MSSLSVLDPVADTNKSELVKLAQRYDFPDFVKNANLDLTMNPGNVAVTAYADPTAKKFPCHTAAATWLSACYYHEKSAEYHPKIRARIEERFQSFSDWYGIRPAYDNLVKRATDLHQANTLPDSSYAYVWQSKDGIKERYYPMTNALQVKVAAEWLFDNKDRIPYADRNVIGKKILEKAARYGAALGQDLNQFIEKQAGQGMSDPADLQNMLHIRKQLAKTQEQREGISKLAEAISNTPRVAMQPNELIKLAATVDLFDYTIGIKGKYTDIIQRPEDVIFKTTYTKAASDSARLCTLQTGNVYSKDQLAKLAKEDVASLFGDDFANEVCTGFDIDPEKIAEVAHTLPRHDAELLEQLLAEVGQNPDMSKSASFKPLDDETLATLAKVYK